HFERIAKEQQITRLDVAMLHAAVTPGQAGQFHARQVVQRPGSLVQQFQQIIGRHIAVGLLLVDGVQIFETAVRALHDDDDVGWACADAMQVNEIGMANVLQAAHDADLARDDVAWLTLAINELESYRFALRRCGRPNLAEAPFAQLALQNITGYRFQPGMQHGKDSPGNRARGASAEANSEGVERDLDQPPATSWVRMDSFASEA